MKYTFHCQKCNKAVEKELKISEYNDYDRKCEDCGEEMERVFGVPQVKDDCGSCGDGGLSCPSGSCTTCPGCG